MEQKKEGIVVQIRIKSQQNTEKLKKTKTIRK